METTTHPGAVKPGAKLDNGAMVIAWQPTSADERMHDGVVLALRLDGSHDCYVTWRTSPYMGTIDTYWGHYHTDLGEALADYNERAGR